MKPESENYSMVRDLLRKSKPMLDSTDDLEIEVIKRIKKGDRYRISFYEAVDFLYGWVYIGWVRRSLITASIALVLVFIYQQGVILKRIDSISRQTIVSERTNMPESPGEFEKLLMVYRNSGHRFPLKTMTISERQMNELIKSVNELQLKYKDLENLIESDPELKKMIEKKLIENNSTKTNL